MLGFTTNLVHVLQRLVRFVNKYNGAGYSSLILLGCILTFLNLYDKLEAKMCLNMVLLTFIKVQVQFECFIQ